jgi:hypothetical protein
MVKAKTFVFVCNQAPRHENIQKRDNTVPNISNLNIMCRQVINFTHQPFFTLGERANSTHWIGDYNLKEEETYKNFSFVL